MLPNLPNTLTLFRIAIIPIMIVLFYMNKEMGFWIAAVFFMFACITDFLDGYFARTFKQTTKLGGFLDPIADKLLVASTLLLLVGFDRIRGLSLVPAIIILCREILVSGLREFLAQTQISVPVSQLAKWKTAVQMGAIGLLIAVPESSYFFSLATIGIIGLWVAAILTLVTGYDYLRASYHHMKT
ncbi:CDP-diacylglycerol--glycerol-3-phosphate 3-phosphatidyltransferase [Candidatus Nucleicultrix amoebiphila FS5]|uniref:CDP-diacylglycerol--glycerol-3-phosphate 3-phosphatidyltransferase n=2 Tax=Candidatus Nucleicultrix TaxID=1509243 RepID=A0A1W6N3D4_9PROT|nr:CDP-diacylglycerol--glycerol-3-phosphate 3-phosphatidyltransferase [Candidatus Nucleicultrix amoebiphila FS5]